VRSPTDALADLQTRPTQARLRMAATARVGCVPAIIRTVDASTLGHGVTTVFGAR